MAGSLSGVRSKFERALKQRSEMQAYVQEFATSDFYEIATERDYSGRIVGRAVNVKTPGDGLGLLIGEFVHSVRSGLDHLVHQLAKNTTPNMAESWAKSSAFPIFKSGPEFRGEKPGRRGARQKMRGLSRPATRTLERLQPYHRRNTPMLWALWQLEELSNLDKHRGMPLTGAVPAQGSVAIKFNSPGVTAIGHAIFPGPIEERRRMIGIRTVAPIKPGDLELKLHVKPFVAFDRKADPPSVRGWPLASVVDGICVALGAHVFPEFNPELHERFDDTFALFFENEPKEPETNAHQQ
ncbi:MAG: hypothetical protein ACJ75S_12570 [Solirubrobacterales bacterium]